MPRRAKGVEKDQRVETRLLVRATPREAEAIKSAANEAGLSVSRFVVQAATGRAEARAPEVPPKPSRLDRRGVTLRRLRDEAPRDTPDREALEWAAKFAWMLRGGPLAHAPAPGLDARLARMTGKHQRRRHNVVVGSLTWASRMAAWAEGLAKGAVRPPEVRPATPVLSRLAGVTPENGLRWAFRASRFLDGEPNAVPVEGRPPDAPWPGQIPPGTSTLLKRLAADPEKTLNAREREVLAWAARLAELVEGAR